MIVLPLLILLTLLGTINYYLAKRYFGCFSYLFPKTSFYIYLGIFVLVTLFILLGFFRSMLPLPTELKSALGVITAYCMGFFVYILIFTLLADGAFLVVRLFKVGCSKELLRFICGVSAMALTLVTVVYGFYNYKQIKVVEYDIALEGKSLENDLNIVVISDLHLGSVGSENRLGEIVEEINSLNPDIICIAGDFFDSDFSSIKNPEKALETLKRLDSKYGAYLCLGNHDAGKTFPQMKEFIEKSGIVPLYEESVVIDNRFVLVGRLDRSPIGENGDMKRKATSEVLSGIDQGLPVIVLDHNPARYEEYDKDVDLIFSGHTHKGQIFPGSIITNLMYEVDYGYYQKDNESPQIIVTSGVGAWGMPMKVGTNSEILKITIKGN